MYKEYNRKHIPLARELRKNMTPWERKLWYEFLKNYPRRFRRQEVLGDYIADFYCSKAKLVIELDGGGHYEEKQQEKDAKRTLELQRLTLREPTRLSGATDPLRERSSSRLTTLRKSSFSFLSVKRELHSAT